MFRISRPFALLLLGLCVLFNFSRSASADDDITQGFKSLGKEILISDSAEGLKKKIFRYGNWYGPGYWGGSEDPNSPGSKGPVDSLDEVAMRHDFAYLLAEQQGAIYGKEEELRLKGIADKIAVDEAKALPADPRKWPNPPRGSVDYEDIKGYRERMISGFTMEKEGYRIASSLTKLDRINNDKLGAILDVTDQKQKFNEADIKRRVKTLTKNWKNVTDFEKATEDADLTEEQKKELFQKYKENPQGFQKTYADYKKQNSVKKSASQLAMEKETAAIARKYKVNPSELSKFFNCVCRSSGGSLGGYYKPGKGGPCVATGPLSSWNTAMPTGKKAIYPCLNQLDRDRYEKDQKIFDEMRRQDKEMERRRGIISDADYEKYVQLIQEENAKSAQAEVAQIREAMANERFMEAADIWNGIKSLIGDTYMTTEYIDGKAQGVNLSYDLSTAIKNGLLSQARSNAKNLKIQNPLGTALKKIAKACSINRGSSNGYCEEMQSKYTDWEKNWKAVVSKEVPAAANLVEKGKIDSAATALQAISVRINTQQLPPRGQDPILVALVEQLKAKRSEYNAALLENSRVLQKLANTPDPRGIVREAEAFKNAWEHTPLTLKNLNYQLSVAAQNVRFAENADKEGDAYREKGLIPNAINRYRVSVKLQKDASVQRKLDSLLSRLDKEAPSPRNAKKQSSGQGKSAGCRSDNDCPPGYVCDSRSGKCGSPFDDGYSSFGKISVTKDDQRSEYKARQASVNQTSTRKRGYSSNDLEQDLKNIQKDVSSPSAQVLNGSPRRGYDSPGTGETADRTAADPVSSYPPQTTPETDPGSNSENNPEDAEQAPQSSTGTTGTETKPADSGGPDNDPPVTPPPAETPVDTPTTETPPVEQSVPSSEDPGFNPTGFLGTWRYSGTRPDGKRRSGIMTFYFAGGPSYNGTMAYSIVDEDGQSDGKGNGTWSVVEGPADSADLTLSIGGKTWTGPISGGEDTWAFNSNHGTYNFRK